MTTLNRVLQLQTRARMLGAALVPVLVGVTLSVLWPISGFIWWATFAALCLISNQLWNFASICVISALLVNELELEEMDEVEIPKATSEQFEMVIKEMGPVLGSFKDQEIVEWIDFDAYGTVQRAFYLGTVEGEYSRLPSDSIVMPPGIVYQFRQVEAQ